MSWEDYQLFKSCDKVIKFSLEKSRHGDSSNSFRFDGGPKYGDFC